MFEGIRHRFPALAAAPQIAYLDSASTTQKPDQVIDTLRRSVSRHTANPGRGTYPWAGWATAAVDNVRERVAGFLGAAPDEIVLTGGATAALNAVPLAWGFGILSRATRS